MVDGRPEYIEQKRWFLFFWLTPYLCGNFIDGFYTSYWLFGGRQYSWKDHNPYGGKPEHKKVMAYYD